MIVAPFPANSIAETLIELEQQFGAVSSETQTIQGLWRHQGSTFRDDLTRIFVDAPDTAVSFEFFRRFKETLKGRFQQIDIWMTTYSIEVI